MTTNFFYWTKNEKKYVKFCLILNKYTIHVFTFLNWCAWQNLQSFYISYLSQRMDFSSIRSYLGEPVRSGAAAVMMDALVYLSPGAVFLIKLLLSFRLNRRTRRSFDDVVNAFAEATPPRWIGVLSKQLWNLYRLGLGLELPIFEFFSIFSFQPLPKIIF